MNGISKRMVSAVAALMLLLTCALSGLVLPVAATNLIVNGDFEDGETNWKTSSSNANAMSAVGDGYGTDGSAGLKLTTTVTTAQRTVGSAYQGAFNELLEPYTTYIFSFDYKVEGSGVARIDVLKSGTDWTGDWKDTDYTATTWTHEEIEFTTGAAENRGVNKGVEWRAARVQAKDETGTGATYFDNFSLEKKVIPATAIELDKTTAEVEMGGTVTLTPTAVPSGAVLPAITWISSDETVATVADGVVTGVFVGTATITATAEGLTPVTCDVTVVPKNYIVNGDFEQGTTAWGSDPAVTIGDGLGKDGASAGLKVSTTIAAGAQDHQTPGVYYQEPFNAALKPNTTYVFSFDYKNEGVGSGGQVYVLRKGTDWTGWKTIDGLTATAWTHKEIEFTTGAEENMNANTGYEWLVRRAQYTTQVGTGATYYDNFKLVEKIVVPLTGVALNKTAVTVGIGKTNQLKVNLTPAEAEVPTVVWASDNEAVATVVDGLITGVSAGTANITATVEGFEPMTCAVTVEQTGDMLTNGDFETYTVSWGSDPAAVIDDGYGNNGTVGLKIDTTIAENATGHQQPGIYYNGKFNGMLKPNTTYIFSFDYKNEGSGFGEVVVVYGGTDWTGWSNISSLTATEWTSKTVEFTTGELANMNVHENYEFKVRRTHYKTQVGSGTTYFDNFKLVEKPLTPPDSVSLNKTATKVGVGKTNQLKVNFTPAEATPPTVVWTSTDETVATVDGGIVTGVSAGTATITATVEGFDPMTCAVTVVTSNNLMVNGDFENYNDSWETGAPVIIADGNGKDGTVGMKIESTVAEGDAHQQPGAYYHGDFNGLLEENSIYKFSFDYKNEGQGFGQIYIVRGGSDWTGWDNLTLSETEWTHKEVTFTTGALQNIDVKKTYEWKVRRVQYNTAIGSGTTLFDNFKLEKVGTVQFADEIHISPDGLELAPFDSSALGITTTPINTAKGVVTWSSSAPDVVSVDQDGNVTALKASGSATITATNDKGKTDSCVVTITEFANIIKNGDFELGTKNWDNLPNIKYGIGRDGGYGMEMTHSGTSGWTTYYYRSSLVGLLEPATTYMFSVDYKRTDENAEARIWTLSMGVNTRLTDFKVGDDWQTYTYQFTTPTNLELRDTWDFALVCEASGNTPIVIDNVSIKKHSSGVNADSIRLNLEKLTLIPGRTGALTANAQPLDADLNDMVWTSSDENVATVEYGVVMGVGKGTAIITGTTKNGKSASCVVTVSGNETLIQDGSFDTPDHSKWNLAGGAVIADGKGRVNSDAAALVAGSTVTQTFTGLKADTSYQLIFRYRSETGNTAPVVTLTNGTAELVKQTASKSSLWKTATYEFTTGATVDPNTTVTFAADGNGVVYVDNVVLAVKASLIDLVVTDVVWDTGYQVKPGTKIIFAATVVNQGEDKVLIGTTLKVELRKNGQVFHTIEKKLEETMETGSAIIVTASVPWVAETGDWVISACANPDLSILELNDSNNTKQIHLRVNDTALEVPKEAQAFNMTDLVFNDEFDNYDSIDMYATGKDGYKWYVTRTWYDTITPDDYTVKDGYISLHQRNAEDASITLSSVDAVTGTGWEYNFGYLETRLRIPNPTLEADGAKPAIWSFPTDKWLEREGKNEFWVEMDWLEYWGLNTNRWPQFPDGYYTITLHDHVDKGENIRWYSNSNAYCNGLGDGEWHVMGWLWTYNGVIAYIDGVEVFRLGYSEDGLPTAAVSNHYGDTDVTGAFSYMNDQQLMLYIAGTMESPLELDYIRVWRGAEAMSMPGDEEESDGQGGTIDISAEDFWNNYCTDIYGDPIMTVTYANCDNILAGEEVWEQLSDARKAEINALLKEKGQKSFEELLAAAKVAKEKGDPDSDAYDQEMVDAKAEDFVWYWLSDDDGNPILEVTEDNFEFILECIAEWNMLDDAVKEAIERILAENGQPTFAELVRGAMILALQNGWAVEDLPEFDFGEEIDWSEYLPDEEPDDSNEPAGTAPVKPGFRWIVPVMIGGGVLVLAAAVVLILLLVRKRKNQAT